MKTAGRMFATSSSPTHQPRVRAVVDVDGERDHREPVADPGGERRDEEQPEPCVPEQREPILYAEPGHCSHARARLRRSLDPRYET